ncbi:MAG: hypothetical protein ACREKS_00195, partial [Candidatus Rokuibacteriota bacterium]
VLEDLETETVHAVKIVPGTRASDALEAAGLGDYWIWNAAERCYFGRGEELYSTIADGERLYVVPTLMWPRNGHRPGRNGNSSPAPALAQGR